MSKHKKKCGEVLKDSSDESDSQGQDDEFDKNFPELNMTIRSTPRHNINQAPDKAVAFKQVNIEKNQAKANKNLSIPVEVKEKRGGAYSPASAAPVMLNPLISEVGDVQRLASLNPQKIKSIIQKQIKKIIQKNLNSNDIKTLDLTEARKQSLNIMMSMKSGGESDDDSF